MVEVADAKKRFFFAVTERLNPELRRIGFLGSGRNFYRDLGQVVQTLNIQGSRYGDECCVNMGIHIAFLPILGGPETHREPPKMRPWACHFQNRLAPSGESDSWWPYKGAGLFGRPEGSATSLVRTFVNVGAPFLDEFSTLERIMNEFAYESLRDASGILPFCNVHPDRAAKLMSEVYRYLGNESESARFLELDTWKLDLKNAREDIHARL